MYWEDGSRVEQLETWKVEDVKVDDGQYCMRSKRTGNIGMGDLSCNSERKFLCQYDCNKTDTGIFNLH